MSAILDFWVARLKKSKSWPKGMFMPIFTLVSQSARLFLLSAPLLKWTLLLLVDPFLFIYLEPFVVETYDWRHLTWSGLLCVTWPHHLFWLVDPYFGFISWTVCCGDLWVVSLDLVQTPWCYLAPPPPLIGRSFFWLWLINRLSYRLTVGFIWQCC